MNRFWLQAIGAFLGAALWLAAFAWLRTSLGPSHPYYPLVLLLLMAFAILVPIGWIKVRDHFLPDAER